MSSSATLFLKKFNRRAWRTTTAKEHLAKSSSHQGLSKVMGLLDLTFLGLGSIVGAGVYVLSGVVANQIAGPAVILSYVVSAVAALLSAFSYAEFAVDLPVAGGAFNYIAVTFGELAAWAVAWNMVLETLLSSAAVSRGFSSYLATLLGLASDTFLILVGATLKLDPAALILIILLTTVLAIGTKESSLFNILISTFNMTAILFVLVTGLPHADTSNIESFTPYGSRGIFGGASIVFFSYIGFDYLANAAEEATNPSRDLPLGIIASLTIATLLYVLMSATIVLMVPYENIDANAPFSAAFVHVGLGWVAKVVSFGALMGIIASTMTGLLSQARLFVVLGRQRLLPGVLAEVSAKTGTPVIATLVTGITAGALALILDIHLLAELVSVGTLFVFWAVSAGVIYRRYHLAGETEGRPALIRLAAITVTSMGLSLSYTFYAPWPVLLVFAVLWIASTASLFTLTKVYFPTKFSTPLFPITPALGILFTVHLVCSLGWPAYVRFVVWNLVGLVIYAVYGMHAVEMQEEKEKGAVRPHQSDGAEVDQQQQHENEELELVRWPTTQSLNAVLSGTVGGSQDLERASLLVTQRSQQL